MSVGSNVVRSFGDLQHALAERIAAGFDDELEEDIDSILKAGRKYWSGQSWEQALSGEAWKSWHAGEASIQHDEGRVGAWVEKLAAVLNLTGPDAQKIALLCNPSYASQVGREGSNIQFAASALTRQAAAFYYHERTSRVYCKCLLLEASHATSHGKMHNRSEVVKSLTGETPLPITPVGRLDIFGAERERQKCIEHTALLHYLLCMSHYKPPPVGELIDELCRMLAQNPNSLLATYLKCRSQGVMAPGARLRVVFTSWVTFVLAALHPLQQPLQSLLPSPLYKFLIELEGPESHLIHLLMRCLDPSIAGPPPHHTVAHGLSTLLYIITGCHTPPPGFVESEPLPDLDQRRLSFLKEPVKDLARRVLHIVTAVMPPKRSSETVLLVMTRVTIASKRDNEVTSIPDDYSSSVTLLQELSRTAGWLFPSCLSTTALFELITACPPSHQEDWWACLRFIDKTAIPYPFDLQISEHLDRSQRILADLPDDASIHEIISLPSERERTKYDRVPVKIGTWFAPMAPIPGPKAAEEAESRIRQRLEGSSATATTQQIFAVWKLPEDKSLNGWMWMCIRCLHILQLSHRVDPQTDKWLVPYLELVNSIIPLFHTMICGPSSDPEDELSHFTNIGHQRLQEIESYLQEIQKVLDSSFQCTWSLPWVLTEVLANLVEWQEAKCYAQRAALVKSCSTTLKCLLRLSRAKTGAFTYNVTESVVSSLRCLFHPGKHASRSPLLHLFWVVEAANKRCSCTYGVVSLLKELLSNPNDYVYFKGDLMEIASYVCEVFTDLSNQWYHCVDEQWELTYDCLHTIVDVIRQTRLQRATTKGPKPAQTPAIHHLIHHNRMGRALAETLGRVCNAIYDPDQIDKGPALSLANKVLLLALQLTEYGLEACEETIKQGQPLPALGTLLCETETGIQINAGDNFTIPALTFHVAAYGPDDLTRIQACRTFGLLCTVAQSGSLLRHVGYRAVTTGKKILTDIDPTSPSGAWTRTTFESPDPQMQQAYKHGLMHPDITNAQMPHIFRSRAEVQMVWEDASLGTMRLLSIIRMMTDMVTHQPQLFMQSFMSQGQMSDPLGILVRNFVYEDGSDSECRPTVREAVLALFVAALESKEPCRSVVLARTVPTLSIKITADAPGLGDKLAGEDGRGCPWHSMPLVKQEDFATLKDLLKQAVEGDVPCVQFDRSRSWTQCGFTKRNKDVVDAPMALTVGPLKSQPSVALRTSILQEAAAIAKKAMEAVGIKDVSVYASWYLSKPVHDPEVWPILAEALAGCRFSIGEWMADDEELAKTERAGDMSWWIFTAGHILRSMAVVSGLYLLYPPHKYTAETANPEDFATAELVGAVRKCIDRVLGKWGDQGESETAGVLGMLIPLKYSEALTIDGLLGQAAGLFYGSVAVPTMHHPRTIVTPRKRLSSGARPTPSPRKAALGDKSPKMVSPLIRPAFADTPGSNEQHLLASADCASLFPCTPFDTPGMQTVQEQELSTEGSPERVTLYEMLRKAETAVHNALRDTGVTEELVAPMMQYANQVVVSMLRGRTGGSRAVSDGVAPCAGVKMPGAFIDMETIKAVYPRYVVLMRVCQELNDVVGLAAAAYYMLTSTSQLISLLLKSTSVCSNQKKLRMLPTSAILDPADWRQGTNTRPSLVYIILKRCLLHPPHDASTQEQEPDPSPLVSLLDSHIRSEACKVLTDMVAEVSSRATLIREGKLDSSEKPFASPQDVHTVNRHIIWNVYSVLQSMHATKEENTIMGHCYSRMGSSRVGEADLILCLCLLGSRNDGWKSFKSDNDGDTAAIASALFPHLHQYLCMDDLEHADQADIDCYKAAFVALCTFGVPCGEERHAVQVARTLLDHLRRLHSSLQDELAKQKLILEVGTSSNTSSIAVQHIVDRVLLILKGLRSMAASPTGIEVFAAADVLPFLSTLRLFMPPSPDAVSPYTPDREKQGAQPWHTLWQALLDTVSAAAIPPPVDGRPKETSKNFAAQVYSFTEKLAPRIIWLLSYQGLQYSMSDETVRSLQLVSCVTRSKIATGTHLSVNNPSVPWIPDLHHSLTYIKDCLNRNTSGAVESVPPLLQGGGLGVMKANAAVAPDLDFKQRALYFDTASQIMSILRLHIVAFLPVSAPVGSLGKASPSVKRLLETLELAIETKGRDFTAKINEVCEGAFRAPEPCIGKLLKDSGYPFSRLQTSQIRRLKEAILVECASYWAPSASSASKELYTMDARQEDVVAAFEERAIFGADDDLTKPAKRLIELTEVMAECLVHLLESSTEGCGRKKDLQISSAVKAAACAIEHAALLRGVYTGALELLAPDESQLLWAGNVIQLLLGERSGIQMGTIPGTVLLKRVAIPLTQLIQCNNTQELRKARAALALHCIEEMNRQPDPTPWLSRTCHTLQAGVTKAPRSLGPLINSTIQLLRKLTKEQADVDISLIEGC
eukprot:TRINITY_DN20911_c0_g1_i1.p1 TRINITY_DN20911_c0_g1~~TRINITY_DN20911_c0_g1_i1.p1  ORF type:complete len:2428 (+),score=696.75 TRINITY_DN20911_c0_g1_i1:54-7337(+)